MSPKLSIMNKMGVIFLTYRRQLQRELIPYQITLKQEYVLRQLARKGSLYPSEIAEMLFCDRPTATVVIKNMEKQHWVRKEQDWENKKQVKVILTESGRKKLADLSNALQASKAFTSDPLECFSATEKEQLDQLLTKLWKSIRNC